MERVGIRGISVYMPEGEESAAEIGPRAGLPTEVVIEKFGLVKKHRAAEGEQVSDMAARAARPLLQLVPPEAIDAVIYFGSPHKDYPVWMAGPRIQHLLGCKNAVAFDVQSVSVGCPIAVNVARSMLMADPHMKNIILAGASKESVLLDYSNARSRFMFNFGDGAAAALLQRGYGHNVVLETAAISDGSFSDFVKVPAGGTVLPASHETVDARQHYLDVSDPLAMKERLDPISAQRFIDVAHEAMARSGLKPEQIRFVSMLHTKRSLFVQVMNALGVPPERQVYLNEYGHMSAIDPLVGLDIAAKRQILKPGDPVLLLSAGTGYTWAATALIWG